MKVKQAIDKINSTPDVYSVFMAGDIIDGTVVCECQDEEDHTLFMAGTRVFEMEDGYVGVRGPYVIKSSTQSWKDIRDLWGEVYAFEVEPVPDVYYKRKH